MSCCARRHCKTMRFKIGVYNFGNYVGGRDCFARVYSLPEAKTNRAKAGRDLVPVRFMIEAR